MTVGLRTLVAAIAVTGMLVMIVPVYGSVITNNQLSVETHQVGPFIRLSNDTTSLPAGNVQINSYGTEANVSMSGTWQLSNTSADRTVNGFVSQNLNKTAVAYSYLEVSNLTGTSHLSSLKLYLNQSDAPGQLELNFSSGVLVDYMIPVKANISTPLNFSISFSPYTASNKLIQYFTVYMSLDVVTYSHSGGGSVYIHETVNVEITEKIF